MRTPIAKIAPDRPDSSISRRQGLAFVGLGAVAMALGPSTVRASGKYHEVTAHNRGPSGAQMAFAPAVLHVAPGDTVAFRHADRGHDVQNFDDMLPPGGAPFSGGIGEDISVTFDTEGTYGFFCRPHQAMGMIGYILVGDFAHNHDQVRAASDALRGPMAARRVAEYFEQISRIGRDTGLL